jgi:hypothetical protein
MFVMWSTAEFGDSTVAYGTDQFHLSSKKNGTCWRFTYGNPNGLQYIHRVLLEDLKPGTGYWYYVQTSGNSSDLFHFTAMQSGAGWSPKVLVYGDMGKEGGSQSLPSLYKEAASGEYAAVVHVGDFAYDLDSDGGENGDEFMRRLEPIASTLPYMTAEGNHESGYNFSHYINRFSMPSNSSSPHWYSWDMGPAHFISYSTEVYFYSYFSGWGISQQLKWLQEDLAKAQTNRAERPWIIAYGHRPMYCSNLNRDDCTTPKSVVRAGLEEMFYKAGVDIILEAHEHSYERLWPVFNETVTANNYIDPKAPVHLVSGTAGCREGVDPMLGPKGPWSAFRSWYPSRHGYGRLEVVNSTHVYWGQVVDGNMTLEDEIWIVQHSHGPFN